MILFVYGTTGELIKLLPLIKEIEKKEYISVCTYQQPRQLQQLFKASKLSLPEIAIGQKTTAKDLESLWRVPWWLVCVGVGFLKNRKNIKKTLNQSKTKPLIIVHGDTMTTLLGAVMGKILRVHVAHIEAGLRSYNWRHPFPEEINRIMTSKMARTHFAPGKTPIANLKKAGTKGTIINTTYNTVLDSLRLAQKAKITTKHQLPKKYCLISIHRNELLAQPKELEKILKKISKFSETMPVVFLDHPITEERIQSLSIGGLLEKKNITRLHKLGYFDFISLLAKAECVITDSGGLQEETAYLGIPCLVHRKATERQEGLGENVVLSYYNETAVDDFMRNFKKYKRAGVDASHSPVKVITKELKKSGFIKD